MKEGGTDLPDKIDFLYKSLVGRSAQKAEKEVLQNLYQEELQDFKTNQQRALDLLTTGEAPTDFTLNQSELAAHTILASTIMNFDEFVMKR